MRVPPEQTEAGGTDHGAPGIRAHYHPDYYGAFVLDPDGTTSRRSATGPSEADKVGRPEPPVVRREPARKEGTLRRPGGTGRVALHVCFALLQIRRR